MSSAVASRVEAPAAGGSRVWRALRGRPGAWVGAAVLAFIVIVAIGAPLFAPIDPLTQNLGDRLMAPGAGHWLGTDSLGRDVLSRLMHGARVSLAIGGSAIVIAVLVGTLFGIVAGYFGGWVDMVIMGVLDALLSIPTLLLGLLVVAMLGSTTTNLIIAIAVTEIAPFARIARAPTVTLREGEFVEAGRALGYAAPRLMFRHILPNIVGGIVVMASMWMATAIRTEASLSFIGLGIKPPAPSWGAMVRDGFENLLDAPWLALVPSLAILATVFALNMLGDALRDAIDPKTPHE